MRARVCVPPFFFNYLTPCACVCVAPFFSNYPTPTSIFPEQNNCPWNMPPLRCPLQRKICLDATIAKSETKRLFINI